MIRSPDRVHEPRSARHTRTRLGAALFVMNTQTQTHDTQIFSAMVEILISSGLGEEDYGLGKPNKRYDQTRYEELASVMNQRGFSNRAGQPLNRNALKQVVHRVRQKEDLMDELKPKSLCIRLSYRC